MEQSPCWEANSFSARQEISCILWKLQAYYGIHKGQSPVPILSQIAPHPFYPIKPLEEGLPVCKEKTSDQLNKVILSVPEVIVRLSKFSQFK